jgi:hypothetical protein
LRENKTAKEIKEKYMPKRYDAFGRPLQWWQSSMHSVMGSEEYHRAHDTTPAYYDTEWDHHPQYKVRVEPGMSYVAETVHSVRKVIVGIAVVIALVILLGGFMVMGAMQTAVSQQVHPAPGDGKICGYATTHDGTKIALKTQTDTSFTLRGDVNSQQNCGY